MIQSFADERTERLYHGQGVKGLPPDIVRVALRKLDMLNNAKVLDDLRSPPGNRLELLHGDLGGLYSIRINAQWRLVFAWAGGNVQQVRIVDYH